MGGCDNLDWLQRWAIELFSDVPNKNVMPAEAAYVGKVSPIQPGAEDELYGIVPLKGMCVRESERESERASESSTASCPSRVCVRERVRERARERERALRHRAPQGCVCESVCVRERESERELYSIVPLRGV